MQPIVYTLRTSTGSRRGSALSEPNAGLMVCLISADGSATLQRLAPVSDSADAARLVQEICNTVGSDAGANCAASLASVDFSSDKDASTSYDAAASSQEEESSATTNNNNTKRSAARRHFQEGSIDEFCFLAPNLGPLESIIIGPESGSWYCDEINVSCSSTGHTDRFVCRDTLGSKDRPAAFLKPIPPGAVVYGSGDAAVVLTKEQAARMQKVNMQDYDHLKNKLLVTTATLTVLGGVGVFATGGGADLTVPFLMGGSAGLLYQAALQKSVDGLGGSAIGSSSGADTNSSSSSSSNNNNNITMTVAEEYYSKPRVGSQMQQSRDMVFRIALGNPIVRIVAVATCLGALFGLLQLGSGGGSIGGGLLSKATHINNSNNNEMGNQMEVKQAVALCTGFLMNKVAVLAVAASPSSSSLSAVDRVKGGGDLGTTSKKSEEADRVE